MIALPEEVSTILRLLEKHGYEAYAVGGCVRDSLLGRKPEDWDVTTSARPEEARRIFHRTIDTGVEHGTITVRMGGQSFELTTYRTEGKYSDSRHPDEVHFVPNLEEDLKRRDFTVNAMAYHPAKGLVDLFGGRNDLEAGVIRCVGDAKERFLEDALRMLRAVRFSAQLGFSIEEGTAEAIRLLHGNIRRISAERIRTELEKLLVSDHPERLTEAFEWGLTSVFFPEWDEMAATPQNTPHHCLGVAEHTIRVVSALPHEKRLRLAGLLHDVGKPVCRKVDSKGRDHFVGHPYVGEAMARKILQRWKYDNETIRVVTKLILFHDERPRADAVSVRRLLSRMGPQLMESLLLLKRVDIEGQSDYEREEKRAQVDAWEALYREIMDRKDPLSVEGLAIGGRDLIRLGVEPGPRVGMILRRLLEEALDDPAVNEAGILEARVRELAGP